MTMWNPFKPKIMKMEDGTLRKPDGSFAGRWRGHDGSISKGAKDIGSVAEALQQINKLQESQLSLMSAKQKAIHDEAQAIVDSMVPDGGEGDPIDKLIMTLAPYLPQIMSKFFPQENPQPVILPNSGGMVAGPHLAPAIPPGAAGPPGSSGAQLNNVLKLIASTPDKMFNKKLVTKICDQQGIVIKDLSTVVHKLNKVI